MSNDEIRQQLLKHIPEVQLDFDTGFLHPLGLGGPARFYTVAKDTVELVQVVRAACEAGIAYRVLGLGDSILIGDKGYDGLLITNQSISHAFSADQSQVVVDSGMSLRRLAILAANTQLGGLIHLYQSGGTIGGALFHNSAGEAQPIAGSLKSVTVLLPPTRIKPEPSIVRYRGAWLTAKTEPGKTRISAAAEKGERHLPVILTAQMQLTSLRADELQRRLQKVVQATEAAEPSGDEYYGPLFQAVPNISHRELFQGSGAYKLSGHGFALSSEYPNYVKRKRALLKKKRITPTVEGLQAFMSEVAAHVQNRHAAELLPAFTVIE